MDWKRVLIFISLFIMCLLLVGCFSDTQKIAVNNSSLLVKPANFYYCETDANCTLSNLGERTCCLYCDEAYNLAGAKYIHEWHKTYCQDPNSSSGCLLRFDCLYVQAKCINNTCMIVDPATKEILKT